MLKFAQENNAQGLMSGYVAFLRALYNIHQNAHWKTNGDEFYGNHLLFQRLYEDTQGSADDAAEKTLGLFGELEDKQDMVKEITEKFTADNYDGSWVQAALKAEQTFLALSETIYKQMQNLNTFTLGLDDMIMSIASKHEVHVYLLKQALGGNKEKTASPLKEFSIHPQTAWSNSFPMGGGHTLETDPTRRGWRMRAVSERLPFIQEIESFEEDDIPDDVIPDDVIPKDNI